MPLSFQSPLTRECLVTMPFYCTKIAYYFASSIDNANELKALNNLEEFSQHFEPIVRDVITQDSRFASLASEENNRKAEFLFSKQIHEAAVLQRKQALEAQASLAQMANQYNFFTSTPKAAQQYTRVESEGLQSSKGSGYLAAAVTFGLIGAGGIVFAAEPLAWAVGIVILSISPPAFIATLALYAVVVAACIVASAVCAKLYSNAIQEDEESSESSLGFAQ